MRTSVSISQTWWLLSLFSILFPGRHYEPIWKHIRRLTWDENCGDTESLRQPSEGVIGPPGKDCEKDPASFLIMLEGDGGVLKLLNYM